MDLVTDVSSHQQITSSFPSHPANSFYYPRLKNLPPIAKVSLTKIKNNQIFSLPIQPTQSNLIPSGNEIDRSLISKHWQLFIIIIECVLCSEYLLIQDLFMQKAELIFSTFV